MTFFVEQSRGSNDLVGTGWQMIYAFHGISYGIPPICLTFSQRVIIISYSHACAIQWMDSCIPKEEEEERNPN
jgi:hypothetical protein